MPVALPTLPYARDALEPLISKQTVDLHFGKHHCGYVRKLNDQIAGTEMDHQSLLDIVRIAAQSANHAVFNNAAQAWNHDFFWASLALDSAPAGGDLLHLIQRDFGGQDALEQEMIQSAVGNFGSGWTWLVLADNHLSIVNTSNAETPAASNAQLPLFTVDVWEHAYYLDYQNERRRYVENVVKRLFSWQVANERLEGRL